MKRVNKSIIFILPVLLILILFASGINSNNNDLIMTSILALFVCAFLYSIFGGNKMIIFTAFLICFFTFVLGNWGVNFIFGQSWGTDFDRLTIKHVLTCVFLSILSIFIGAAIGNIKANKMQNKIDFKEYQQENDKYEGTIRILFYITLVFTFLTVVDRAIFVFQHSYLDLYVTEGIGMPYMVRKLSECNDFLFFCYLAILPYKKKAKTPIFLYFLVNALSILGGARGGAVKVTIMVLAYCFFRNHTDDEKWVKKKHVIMLCIAVPVVIVLLSLYNFWRSGASATYYGFWNEFLNFFTTQGGSIKLIGYESKFHNVLPETNVSYTFGPIIAWYKHGFIGSIINTITGQEFIKYAGNTIGEALYGNNLGATLTYLVMPGNYLGGIGLGTQYIAELYSDFGYTGVILFNLLLGWFITKCRFVYFKKWYWNAITIGVVYYLFGIGRDFATTFAAYYVSVLNWVTVFLIYRLSKIKFKKYGGINNENIVDL